MNVGCALRAVGDVLEGEHLPGACLLGWAESGREGRSTSTDSWDNGLFTLYLRRREKLLHKGGGIRDLTGLVNHDTFDEVGREQRGPPRGHREW